MPRFGGKGTQNAGYAVHVQRLVEYPAPHSMPLLSNILRSDTAKETNACFAPTSLHSYPESVMVHESPQISS